MVGMWTWRDKSKRLWKKFHNKLTKNHATKAAELFNTNRSKSSRSLDTQPTVMRSYEGSHLVDVELNSPDRIMARSEPWHEGDKDTCRHLSPADTAEDIDLAGLRSIPREALLILLRYIVQPGAAKHRWRQAQIRLAILAHMVNLDGIGELSFQALGEELGCTRALLSMRSLELIDGLSIDKTRNGKKRSSRETYRKTATKAHTLAGHTMTVDGRQAASGTGIHKTTASRS